MLAGLQPVTELSDYFLVQAVRAQIVENQKAKDRLESEFPELIASAITAPGVAAQPGISRLDVMNQIAKVRESQSKVSVLTEQLAQIRKEASALNDEAGTITDLQRKRDLLEQSYTHFSTSLNNARFDETLGAGRNSNINTIQEPSPASSRRSWLFCWPEALPPASPWPSSSNSTWIDPSGGRLKLKPG